MINVEIFVDGDTYKLCLKKYKTNVAKRSTLLLFQKKERKGKDSQISELLCKVT